MGIVTASSEELWVVLTTLLLLAKFTVGSLGLRFSSRRLVAPAVRLLQILNYYAVTYTLGLMKPSTSSCFFFQVWAVLIVTMQQSGNIGRPYRPKEMSLVDLLTALWSANELEAAEGTPPQLETALWIIWSTNAARIIWYYVSSHRTASASMKGVKVLSDYMATVQHAAAACPRTMKGYRYLVVGEEELRMDVAPPAFTPEMVVLPSRPADARIVTVEEVWEQAGSGAGDRLLGEATDRDSRFKDVCLSFALYKLQSRRFHDFPIAEAAHPTTRRLVAGAVLEEGPDGYERALRVTEAELSFLRGSIYSKHAVVFAAGFPCVRLLLSLLMTAATLYLFYAVRDMPEENYVVRNRISHGVVVTRCIIAIIVCRELMEVGVYVLSQWTKVWIICHYIKLKRRQGHGRVATLRRLAAEKAARIMFAAIWRGRWDQRIRQYNLLMSARTKFPIRPLVVRKVKLQSEVKRLVFGSLKAMIMSVPDHQCPSDASWAEQTNALLMSFRNAFADGHGGSAVEDTAGELEGDTHNILVWHVATSLCQIKLLDEAAQGAGRGADLYSLPPTPTAAGDEGKLPAAVPWPRHYAAAVSLSNYCAYLATQALVPDNGLVANKVFDAVRGEARDALRGCGAATLAEIRERLVRLAGEGNGDATIVGMGARLSEKILSLYGRDELWERLGRFWAGFLLHLSASTRAAKHRIHLQGRGELTTHLWVLLSHAGFLGSTSHGEQLLDPDDLNDACDHY
ncbi:uncharacterized protein [Miscanthus floridulus]|uniref:uncharacterized protein n=1 Tax=Miscanthus floridulus TaxID=154761 RepID=UPI003458BFE3